MKEKFVKSTIILIIGGLITKVLGMLIRIIITRLIGVDGLGLYMLVLPTFNLFITIATLSLPIAISKLVSENNKNNKKLVFGIIPIAFIFNLVVIVLLVIFAPFLANNLLKNGDLYYPILSIAITLPFITLSCIVKGYFLGKQRMTPHVISNVFEQIIRIITIVCAKTLFQNGIVTAVTGLIVSNCISELASIIILLLFIPKKIKIKKDEIKPDITYIKDIFSISIPTTLGRLISSIGGFLEPIILTLVFIKTGYSSSQITIEYGIITGYVIAMVTMPNFLSSAIGSALLPVISRFFVIKDNKQIIRKMKQAILYSLLVGVPFTIVLFFFPNFSLKLLFNTTIGSNYLKIASLIFFLSYILSPLTTVLQAINKSKQLMILNLVGTVLKIMLIFFLSYLNIGMYSLLFAYLGQFLFLTIFQFKIIKKAIK